jgi:hypothetical protein
MPSAPTPQPFTEFAVALAEIRAVVAALSQKELQK